MLKLFKRDHFFLGYEYDDILYIKNGKSIAFDNMKRFGYDSSKVIDRHNNLLVNAPKIKTILFMPLRENVWLAPSFTVVCALPLHRDQVSHLYRFCKLMGGTNITISHVSSVKSFLEKPSLKLIRKNYYNG
ncbi:MAG TPA: hypothetical protein VK750_10130 [Cytophagaceae bacterium]|jgi:hypothetical protein|nr:hypothetical protein [Cytophagaceae bacterium]